MTLLTGSEPQRSEQLRKLTEISRALTYATALDQILPLAVSRAAEIFSAQSALLMLSDEEGLLRVGATHGVTDESLLRFREPLDETLARRLQGLLGVASQESFLGVPLVAHGAVIGLLAIVKPEANPCTDEEEWLLSAVADQVAVALENARLTEEIQRAREERALAERGAGEADDAKDRALATLSHDLRSPLNAIDAYSELMEMEIFGAVTDRQREALGRIRLSGRHLLAVLENVLEMARIDAGVVRVHEGTVELGAVVQEALLLVRHSAEAKEQQLLTEPCPPLVVGADPDRLRQVLINLVGNAIKYTPPKGNIRVVCGEREAGSPWGLVSVSDSGPGIPADKLEAVFQPYFRLASSEADAPEGAGLGLAISRQLIRQMGGEVEVESEPGRGSTFTVRLPLRPSEPAG